MLRSSFIFCFIFYSYFAISQTKGSIQLILKDTHGVSVENSLIAIRETQDSLWHYVHLKEGQFQFKRMEQGSYQMIITSLSFRDTSVSFQLKEDTTLEITLCEKNIVLKDAVVNLNRNFLTVKDGNLKAQVDNTILNTLPDVMEILSKIPSLQVSNDRESVSVLGKGTPLIYLGNQRITRNDISLLAVSDIKYIEIINNPSSKYESEGRAVILITKKGTQALGARMDLSETASLKRRFENRWNMNAGTHSGKNDWKLNLQYNLINRWEGLKGDLLSEPNSYQSDFHGTSIGLRRQWITSAGFYRSLKNNDYVSMNVGGRWQDEFPIIHTATEAIIHHVQQEVQTQAVNYQNRPYITLSVHYQKTLNRQAGKLFFGGQFSDYSRIIRNTIYNNPDHTSYTLTEKRKQQFDIKVTVARVDYEVSLVKKIKMESGLVFNNAQSFTNFTVSGTTPVNMTYHYHEFNGAAYLQLSGAGNNVAWNVGSRWEQTHLEGATKDGRILPIQRNYLFLLPKAGVSFKLNGSNSLLLNYSNSVRRPDYSSLNQTSNYITPFLERSSNVYMKPSAVHEISLNYQYKTYSLKLSTNYTKNPAYYITERDSMTQNLRIINRNLKEEWGGQLMVTLPLEYKQFTSTNILSAGVNQVHGIGAVVFPVKPFYYLSTTNQWKITHRMTVMANAWWASEKYEGVFKHNAQFAVDLSVSQKVREHWSITLNAFDIFRSLNYRETFQMNDVYSNILYYENVREWAICIKNTIGNGKNSTFKIKEVNDLGNRIN